MRGRTDNTGRVSRRNSNKKSLTEVLKDIQMRLDRLELHVFAFQQSSQLQGQSTSRPGRAPAFSVGELVQRRDALINWLEENWPELSVAIRKARTSDDLRLPLQEAKGIGKYPFQPEFYNSCENYLDDLWAFLHSGRFYGNPRNVANAMAGLPHMSWKRSFDLCSSQPSELPISPRAVADYLRRKVPDRLRALQRAKTIEEVREILGRRTKDHHLLTLRKFAEHMPRWIEMGTPAPGGSAVGRKHNRL